LPLQFAKLGQTMKIEKVTKFFTISNFVPLSAEVKLERQEQQHLYFSAHRSS